LFKMDDKTDLHIHTTASDGVYPPAEVVRMALSRGLTRIAITDHDTVEGIAEARAAAEGTGLEVIPGVELGTKYKGRSVDVLGYDLRDTKLLAKKLAELRASRESRAERILKKFAALGMPVSMEDVLRFSQGGAIGRPHIARAVVDKGYAPDVQTVFDLYLADGMPCDVPKAEVTPGDAVAWIHRAGGKAVLAHPKLIGDDGLVAELLDAFPFDGLEVWHRKHAPEDAAFYRNLARERGLWMTGGSDFHDDTHRLGEFGFRATEG